MLKLLMEVKQLSQRGIEKAILKQDNISKEIFFNIMLKTELAINKYSEKEKNKKNLKEECNARTYERIDENSKYDMYLIAYCFSKYEHTSLFPNFSQDKSFIIAAEKLGVKKNTLKNSRDWFDGHNNSHRNGWWQQPLPEDMQKFKDVYDKKDRITILQEARTVLGLPIKEQDILKDFGLNLKQNMFYGHFKKKEDVEKFIQIVLNKSPNIAKDLVEQCSIRTFKACYNAFLTKYNQDTERLAEEIVTYDTLCATNSKFSLWIRARFIQEIFKNNLSQEVLKQYEIKG